MKLHILDTLRDQWTDAVVARWASTGKYKLRSSSPCACEDCGHPVAYVKGDGRVMCSACMIISAKFPYRSEGDKEKTTQLVNGQGIGGVGLFVLPERNECHIWLNDPLQTHAAIVESDDATRKIIIHPTSNKGNLDRRAFVGDMVLWRFSPGEAYWAGVCQENDAHKVSSLLQDAVPALWNGTLFIKKSVMGVAYLQPETLAVLKAAASSPFWLSFADMLFTRTRILGELAAFEDDKLEQMEAAETTAKKSELSAMLEAERQRLGKVLLSQAGNEVKAADGSCQTFGQFMVSSLGDSHDEVLMSVHENLLSIWS